MNNQAQDTTIPAVRSKPPPARLMRLLNPLMRVAIRSRLGRRMEPLAVLRYHGRHSGRRRDIPVGVLAGLTFLGAVACGLASWLVIEKPAMSWKWRSRRIPPRIDSPAILKQGNLGPDADVRQGGA